MGRPVFPKCWPEITLGENVCRKIKEIYFLEVPWADCYQQVADKLTLLKKKIRPAFDNDNVKLLKEVSKWSLHDIYNALED